MVSLIDPYHVLSRHGQEVYYEYSANSWAAVSVCSTAHPIKRPRVERFLRQRSVSWRSPPGWLRAGPVGDFSPNMSTPATIDAARSTDCAEFLRLLHSDGSTFE